MATTTNLNTLKINYLTQAQFDALETKEANEIYLTPDASITTVTAGSGLSGGGSSGSVTLNHSNSVTAKSTQALYPITFDGQGHITGAGTAVTSLPASDVYSWAKASTKPSYTYSEVGAASSGHTHTTSLTQTGTSTITLESAKNYTLTAGGTSVIFKMPTIPTNTDSKLQVAEVTSATQYYPLVGTGTDAATRQYDTTGFKYKGTNGTTSAVGSAILELGNSTGSGTANNKQAQLIMYGSNTKKATITLAAPSADIALALPTSGGTLALTSQIPTVPTITLNGSDTTSASFYAPTSAGTSGNYLKSSGSGAPTWASFPTIPSITLNGSSSTSPSFYAPTSVGTSGYVLKSNGSGAPTWTSAVLTDENVKNTTITTASTIYLTGSTSSSTATGGLSKHASANLYLTADSSTDGYSRLTLGNSTATGTAGARYGLLRLYGNTAYYVDIRTESGLPTGNRTIYLPSYAGSMYLTCTSTTNAVGGATTAPVYVDDTGRIQAVTSIPYSLLTGTPTIPDVSGKIDTAGSGLSKSGTTLNHASTITAGTVGTSSATSGITLAVPYVTYNGTGHITATGTHTHTVPTASTTAAGVMSKEDKIYLNSLVNAISASSTILYLQTDSSTTDSSLLTAIDDLGWTSDVVS